MMIALFLIGRVLFGGYFFYNGFNHFRNHSSLSGYAQMKGVPMSALAVYVSGGLLLIGSIAVLLNFYAVIGLWCLVAFLIATTFVMHAFWKESDQQAKAREGVQFGKNIALLGAALIMIALA